MRAIFLMNNYNYIQNFVTKATFMEALHKLIPKQEFLQNLDSKMAHSERIYIKLTWGSFKEVLHLEDFHPGNITKKEKEDIKTRYSIFNEQFEKIVNTQKSYCVPNEALRIHLREISIALILPLFKKFDMHYRHSGKNFA